MSTILPNLKCQLGPEDCHFSSHNTSTLWHSGMLHVNADALSRLPLPSVPAHTQTPPELVLLIEQLAESLVTYHHIKMWSCLQGPWTVNGSLVHSAWKAWAVLPEIKAIFL